MDEFNLYVVHRYVISLQLFGTPVSTIFGPRYEIPPVIHSEIPLGLLISGDNIWQGFYGLMSDDRAKSWLPRHFIEIPMFF